jgi:hypothetical protein
MKNENMNKAEKDNSGFLLYNAPDGEVRIEAALEDETLWLTQKAMAELFGGFKVNH